MFESIADITAAGSTRPRGASARAGEPVRRQSQLAGREGIFWRRTDRKTMRQVVLAAKRYELTGRAPGSRSGPLGSVAIEVLELLTNLVDFRTGRLEPSIETLMRYLKRSRDAIVRALKALRTHGFLDWLRRYVPTGNEGRGPQVKQTSNAYRLFLPSAAARLLGRLFARAPIPDDHGHAQEIRRAEFEAARASLTELERTMMVDVADPESPIGAALIRMAKARALYKERESAKRSESLC